MILLSFLVTRSAAHPTLGVVLGTRRGKVQRSAAMAAALGALTAVAIAGPVLAQDPGTGTDDDGNTVAVGAPPPPPPPPPAPTTTIVAVGQPPVPPPPPAPTTTVVAVGQPPVPPPAPVVASQPATMVNRPIVERPAAVNLVGETARQVAASIERISAQL